MAIIKYIGPKKVPMPIFIPIGVQQKGAIKETIFVLETVVLSDSDSEALVKLDSHNFSIVEEKKKKKREAVDAE